MFQTQRSNNGTTYLIGAAVCFAAGYGIATYIAKNADVQITKNQDNVYALSYQKSPPKNIILVNGVVTLGTLRQRLEDLLREDPHKIRQLTKESLNNDADSR